MYHEEKFEYFVVSHLEFTKVVKFVFQRSFVPQIHRFSESMLCFGTGPVPEASQKTTSRWKDHLDSWNGKVQFIDGNNYNFEFCVFTQELTPRKTVRMSGCVSLLSGRKTA